MTSKYTNGPWIAKGENGHYNNSRNSWSVYDDAPLHSEVAPITLADGTVIAFAVASSEDQISDNRVDDIARLIAAAPELLEALKQCIQLAWEDSREISFDSTVHFGLGYDFDGVDKFRFEIHTPIGSWMVWSSSGKYSAYRDNGDMWFEQFDSRADAEELVLSCIDRLCPTYPTAVARAAIAKATGQ